VLLAVGVSENVNTAPVAVSDEVANVPTAFVPPVCVAVQENGAILYGVGKV